MDSNTTWPDLWCVSGHATHHPGGVRTKVVYPNSVDARLDLDKRATGGYLQLGFSGKDMIRSDALRAAAKALAKVVGVDVNNYRAEFDFNAGFTEQPQNFHQDGTFTMVGSILMFSEEAGVHPEAAEEPAQEHVPHCPPLHWDVGCEPTSGKRRRHAEYVAEDRKAQNVRRLYAMDDHTS